MSPRRSILALATLALAGCPGGSTGHGVVNLGISAVEMVGKDELWALVVSESLEANTDLNGDGDAIDGVVRVYDHGTGDLTDTGLALGTSLTVGDVLIAFGVPELDQGDTDLNGDGDTSDVVLHVYDRRTGATTNTGFANGLFAPAIGLGLVAFAVPEAGQGNVDLDGSGMVSGSVLHVHDSRTLVTTNAAREVSSDIHFHDHQFAFQTTELSSGDLNGDGDAADTNVFQLFDSLIGGVISVPLAVLGDALATRVEDWYLLVSEPGQGLDLDGDGDALDGVYQRIEPHLQTVQPVGFSAASPVGSVSNGSFAALRVHEVDGLDRNADGDFLDTYAVLYDPVTEQAFAPALALAPTIACVFLDDRLAVVVDEALQGDDLNSDGDEIDRIVHLLDPVLETSTNLGFEASGLAAAGGRLVVTRVESEAGNDWNGDGDQLDLVFFVWDPESGALSNTRAATNGVLSGSSDSSLLFVVPEIEDRGDLNGDGDTDDQVYEVYEIEGRRNIGLSLAAGSGAGVTRDGAALFLVSESAQGRDLNADGDQVDGILHVRE